VTVRVVAGADRYATSADIAEAAFPGGVPSGQVILATGTNFPDGLAANYLAGQLDAPVLLTSATSSDPLFSETVGGTGAVGPSVLLALAQSGYSVTQLGGATRYDTSEIVDTQAGQTAGSDPAGEPTAIIATGDDFPDALAAGPLAWARHFPIVLTDGSQAALSSQALATLTTDKIKDVLLMGGSSALNPGINAQLTGLGITIDMQFAGADRTDTAAQLWDYLISAYGFSKSTVILASGANFPDALSAGPWGGSQLAGIVLTEPDETLGTYTADALAGASSTLSTLDVAGGPAAVPTATITAAQSSASPSSSSGGAGGGGGGGGGGSGPGTTPGETVLPELVGASIVSTTGTSTSSPHDVPGTVVQYVFNQTLAGATLTAADFKLWPSDDGVVYNAGDAGNGSGPCTGATCPASTNVDAVNMLFDATTYPALTSPDGFDAAGTLTLATVVEGAVVTGTGALSPTGSARVTPAAVGIPGSGQTDGPDLASIGAIRQASTTYPDSSAIDLTFDKPAYPQAPGTLTTDNAFDLVFPSTVTNSSGVEVACFAPEAGNPNNPASASTIPGFDALTSTVTIVCPNPSGTASQTMTTSDIARIVDRLGAVGTAAPGSAADVWNDLQSVPGAGGSTLPSPSLSSVVLTPGSGAASDEAVFTFDTGVTVDASDDFELVPGVGINPLVGSVPAALVGSGSCTTSAPATGASGCQVTSTTTTLLVELFFPSGTFRTYDVAGGLIEDGAVTNVNSGTLSAADAVEASDAAGSRPAAGSIAAVQLSSASLGQFTNPFGQIAYRPTWTFDEAINPASLADGSLHLYDEDGTELTCSSSASVEPSTNDQIVLCTSFVDGNTTAGAVATLTQIGGATLATVDAGAVTGNTALGLDPPAATANPAPEGAVSV